MQSSSIRSWKRRYRDREAIAHHKRLEVAGSPHHQSQHPRYCAGLLVQVLRAAELGVLECHLLRCLDCHRTVGLKARLSMWCRPRVIVEADTLVLPWPWPSPCAAPPPACFEPPLPSPSPPPPSPSPSPPSRSLLLPHPCLEPPLPSPSPLRAYLRRRRLFERRPLRRRSWGGGRRLA